MKPISFILTSLILLVSCQRNSVVSTHQQTEQREAKLQHLQKDMTQAQVRKLMQSEPYKKEEVFAQGKAYEVWFYQTKKLALGINEPGYFHLTPLIFENGYLVGLGKDDYEYLKNINNEKTRQDYEEQQQYTDDEDEWSPSEHRIFTPSDVETDTPSKSVAPQKQSNPSATEQLIEGMEEEQAPNSEASQGASSITSSPDATIEAITQDDKGKAPQSSTEPSSSSSQPSQQNTQPQGSSSISPQTQAEIDKIIQEDQEKQEQQPQSSPAPSTTDSSAQMQDQDKSSSSLPGCKSDDNASEQNYYWWE